MFLSGITGTISQTDSEELVTASEQIRKGVYELLGTLDLRSAVVMISVVNETVSQLAVQIRCLMLPVATALNATVAPESTSATA